MSPFFQRMVAGLKLPASKSTTRDQAIATLPLPSFLSLAINAAEPLVKVGDHVLKGQKIAEGRICAHAPSSGTVRAISNTDEGYLLSLDCDGQDTWIDSEPVSSFTDWDFKNASTRELLIRLHDAGIIGMGGAGFPLTEKLLSARNKPIETLIINAAECEPMVTSDEALICEKAYEIIQGIKILQQLSQAANVVIAIEDDKTAAIAAFNAALINHNAIRLQIIETRYPSGSETQLITMLTGKRLNAGQLPADVGVLSHNVATAFATYQAIVLGRPLISRVITVAGSAIGKPCNMEVLIGTLIDTILNACSFNADQCKSLLNGGPLTGSVIHDTSQGVRKTQHAVIAAGVHQLRRQMPETACIRCGHCSDVCPENLLPQQLLAFGKSDNIAALTQHRLTDCIECAACEVVCPSHIPLVDYYSASKALLAELKQEQEKAQWAQARFERQQARKAVLEAEKEAKRLARTQALLDKSAISAAASVSTENIKQSTTAATEPAQVTSTAVADDPVAKALAAARAKRGEPATDNTNSSQPIAKNDPAELLKDRIHTLTTKLATLEGPAKEVVERSIAAMQEQLATMQEQFAALQTETLSQAVEVDDPVAAALARAKAKRASDAQAPVLNKEAETANLDEKALLQKRIDTLQAKLETVEGPAHDVIARSLATMQQQLLDLDKAQS